MRKTEKMLVLRKIKLETINPKAQKKMAALFTYRILFMIYTVAYLVFIIHTLLSESLSFYLFFFLLTSFSHHPSIFFLSTVIYIA